MAHVFINDVERKITLTMANDDLSEREFQIMMKLKRLAAGVWS